MTERRICSAPGCNKPIRKRRYAACAQHDYRMHKNGSWELPSRGPQIADRFGRLVIVEVAEPYINPASGAAVRRWRLRCECGGETVKQAFQLRSETRDCGCGRRFKAPPIGKRFGRLTVIAPATNDGGWRIPCRCDCGVETLPLAFSLRSGASTSCGGHRPRCPEKTKKAVAAATTKHGMHGTAEYRAWRSMKGRCHCPTHKAFARYGGRGIYVWPEWRESFEAFLAHIGPKPDPSYSLDRIDNNRGYEPGNVRWADRSTQNKNRRPFIVDPSNRRPKSSHMKRPPRLSRSWLQGKSEYNSWIGMKMRCYNPNDQRYADYGGRGIIVAPEWQRDFSAFLRDMGRKPSPSYSLDRIDNDGDYEPSNCRWADGSTQTRNRRPFLLTPSGSSEPTA